MLGCSLQTGLPRLVSLSRRSGRATRGTPVFAHFTVIRIGSPKNRRSRNQTHVLTVLLILQKDCKWPSSFKPRWITPFMQRVAPSHWLLSLFPAGGDVFFLIYSRSLRFVGFPCPVLSVVFAGESISPG